ncbi:hypothetical protein [Dyadobacter psychrotolerans]|jgi:hypothetical protein|nr:hypothetical protein [Dyadobacter psychrotolerans]
MSAFSLSLSTSYFHSKAPQGGLQDMPVTSCDGPAIINLSAYG